MEGTKTDAGIVFSVEQVTGLYLAALRAMGGA
jgi:hypothetical protein